MPATVSRGDTGLSNRKCSWLASVWTGEQPYSVRSSFKTTTLNSFIWVVVCVITDINEFLLLSISHLSQAVVAPSQVSLQARQGRHHHALHLAPLRPAAGRRKAQPADAATGTDAARQHVALVEHPRVDLQGRTGDEVAVSGNLARLFYPANLQNKVRLITKNVLSQNKLSHFAATHGFVMDS